jgi:hypothetical protein
MTSLCAPLPPDTGESVTLTIAEETATSWRTSKHRITGDRQYDRYRNRNLHAAERPPLPCIQPGQLWVLEQSSTDPHLSPLGHHAITSANVVIYDRPLHPIVAVNLPLGGYAEPTSLPDGVPDRTLDRCIQFARDGWSVVWFVDRGKPHDAGSRRIGRVADRLIDAGCPQSQSVSLFANANGSLLQQTETELDAVGIAIAAAASEDSLAIAFAAVGAGAGPDLRAISSNGLAG